MHSTGCLCMYCQYAILHISALNRVIEVQGYIKTGNALDCLIKTLELCKPMLQPGAASNDD